MIYFLYVYYIYTYILRYHSKSYDVTRPDNAKSNDPTSFFSFLHDVFFLYETPVLLRFWRQSKTSIEFNYDPSIIDRGKKKEVLLPVYKKILSDRLTLTDKKRRRTTMKDGVNVESHDGKELPKSANMFQITRALFFLSKSLSYIIYLFIYIYTSFSLSPHTLSFPFLL